MFTDYEEDALTPESVPNLIFNDTEDWETIPNSNLIFLYLLIENNVYFVIKTNQVQKYHPMIWQIMYKHVM